MDKITGEDISPDTERERTSPLSPKRPRTDCTKTNDGVGKSRFDFPELLTFQRTVGKEKPHDDAHTGSSKVCFITAERLPVKDEQHSGTETDNFSSYPVQEDAGEALAEPHTSKDAGADTSSQPDCNRLGKSLEDEPPGGCGLPAAHDKDGRQVQNSVNQTRALTLGSSGEGVRCQPDCTREDVPHDTGFCDTQSQSAGVEESNQKNRFSENIPLSEEKEDGSSPMCSSDYTDSKTFYSNPKEQPSGSLVRGVKNEEIILQLQICESENVAVCDGETKGQVNENDTSEKSAAEGSIVSCDVVLVRNIATESARLDADDFCGAKGEHAAGEMIAEARSETADHTTETPMPARISEGPAEGDNDTGPFSVIDPAIWSETDSEAEQKRCSSASAAGVELSLSVEVRGTETPRPLCGDVRPSREVSAPDRARRFNQQSRTQQSADEKDLWQSHTEPQACSDETHNETGDGGGCRWESGPSGGPCRPAKPPPAGDGRQESHDTVGHQLKEQDLAGCSPVGPEHLKTQGAEYLLDEMEEREGSFEEEIRADAHGKSDVEEEQSEETWGLIFTHMGEELVNFLECLCDHSYTAERKGEAEETDMHNSEMIVTSMDDEHQQHEGNTSEECISECSVSETGHKLTLEEENKLSFFSGAETFTVENKDDISDVTCPPTADAVVPSPRELLHSQNADNSPAGLNRNDRFSPVPSALTFSERAPGGFDTFEKIQLSLHEDEDEDAGLSSSPLLTSLPGQLLKTPRQQLYRCTPEAESTEAPEEEEVERSECHTENPAKGFSSSDRSCNELPNSISAADVVALGRPEQQPLCESSCNSSECFQEDLNTQSVSSTIPSEGGRPASGVNDSPKFEMEKQFSMVLKELNLFFEISKSDFASRESSPEQCREITEDLEGDTSNCKEHLSSPGVGRHRDTMSDDADEDRGLELCEGDPVVSVTSGSGDGEQEVPLGSQLCQETCVYTAEKLKEPGETEQRRKTWSPSFPCRPSLDPLSHRAPEQHRRLEPLRTCTRPIRVGLSKRAKTKHLHRPHPYK